MINLFGFSFSPEPDGTIIVVPLEECKSILDRVFILNENRPREEAAFILTNEIAISLLVQFEQGSAFPETRRNIHDRFMSRFNYDFRSCDPNRLRFLEESHSSECLRFINCVYEFIERKTIQWRCQNENDR